MADHSDYLARSYLGYNNRISVANRPKPASRCKARARAYWLLVSQHPEDNLVPCPLRMLPLSNA
jgi:hypothetical protein